MSSLRQRWFRRARTCGCCLALLSTVSSTSAQPGRSAGAGPCTAALLAQADEPQPQVAPPPPSPDDKTVSPEQKRKVRSAVVLLSVLAGIALTGLLLIIVAISVRGMQRKLAGPTRLDREPQDLLPDVAPLDDAQQPAEQAGDDGAAADETQYT